MTTDVFLSYSRRDKEAALGLAEKLKARGLTIWWDRVIPPGKEFDEVIEEALEAAGCVVVLWSEASVASRWVKTEAQEGARRGVLIPLLIEPVKIPLEFRRLQTADLTGWTGTEDDPEFHKVVTAILRQLGQAANPGQTQAEPRESPPEAPESVDTSLGASCRLRRIVDLWGHRRLAIGHLVGGILLSRGYIAWGIPPNNALSVIYFGLLPVAAVLLFFEKPYRVAGVCWFNVFVAILVLMASPLFKEDFVGWQVALGYGVIYLVVASIVWTRTVARKVANPD